MGREEHVDRVPLLGKWSHYYSSVKHILKKAQNKILRISSLTLKTLNTKSFGDLELGL